MNLFSHLQSIEEHLISLRKLEDYLSFDMSFPTTWGIPKSTQEITQIVPFDSGAENKRGISFVTPFQEKEVEKTVSAIQKIIKLNKEKELKNRLFEETVQKLKSTFDKKDLESLKTLEFTFIDKPIIPTLNDGEGQTIELVEE